MKNKLKSDYIFIILYLARFINNSLYQPLFNCRIRCGLGGHYWIIPLSRSSNPMRKIDGIGYGNVNMFLSVISTTCAFENDVSDYSNPFGHTRALEPTRLAQRRSSSSGRHPLG